jgi:hypothetical protein
LRQPPPPPQPQPPATPSFQKVSRTDIPKLPPGRGIPVEVSENDYDGSADSSEFSPSYNTDEKTYYADFRIKNSAKFYRMYGKSAEEVTDFIQQFKNKYE